MRSLLGIVPGVLIICQLAGCDESVNLNAPFEQKLVVYCVLTNRSDTQFARVYTTYPVGEGVRDSTGHGVEDVTMTVRQGPRTYTFSDTSVVGDSLSRPPVWVLARVAHGLSVEEGKTYELVVNSPSLGEVHSSVTSLSRGEMYVENPESLEVPTQVARFPVIVTLGSNAAAYILHFFLDYDDLVGGTWRSERVEVPWDVQDAGGGESPKPIYPVLLGRGQNTRWSPSGSDGVSFSGTAYRYVVSRLRAQFPGGDLRFKRAVFSLTQIDHPMYAYYSTVNGFPGSATLRLDDPDYSNIVGGLGVFATMRGDLYALPLSPTLGF